VSMQFRGCSNRREHHTWTVFLFWIPRLTVDDASTQQFCAPSKNQLLLQFNQTHYDEDVANIGQKMSFNQHHSV